MWPIEKIVPSAWFEHAPFAFWLVDAVRPRSIVELGTHNGFSYLCFCQAVERLGLDAACVAIDTWKGDDHAGFYGEKVFRTLREYNESRYSGFSRLMRSTFADALSSFDDGSIDLLHIDGRHGYDDVREDFGSWLPKLSDRAVVLFHDTQVRANDFGVWRFWSELSAGRPSFEFEHGYGLGVLPVGAGTPASLQRLADLPDEDAATVRSFYASLGLAVAARAKHELAEREKAAEERRVAAHRKAAEAAALARRGGAATPP